MHDHRAEHPTLVKDCEGCSARMRSIGVSPKVKGHGELRFTNRAPSTLNHNSWERGTLKDHRGVPIHDERGAIPLKRAGEQRHKIESRISELETSSRPSGL